MVFVEGSLVLVHVGVAGPGFRNEHGHDVGQRTAGLVKKLDGVIERSGVASVGRDDRVEIVDLAVVERALEHRLAGIHPTNVAADSVDFAVVGHVAVGVRELPTGESVGGEPLVDQAKGAGNEGIGKFEVKLFNLRGQHEALVNDGATGEGWDVEIVLAFDFRHCDLVLSTAANAIEQALESFLVEPFRPGDKKLLDVRLGGAGLAANGIAIHRRIAPAEHDKAFFLGNAFKHALALQTAVLVDGQKAHGHAIAARIR